MIFSKNKYIKKKNQNNIIFMTLCLKVKSSINIINHITLLFIIN